jgi:mRNA-degrading endonuclease RelE of RelBE toxin-antitoxin system
MRPNSIAPWELRIGKLRVYYEFEEQPEKVVTVLAIGIKERDRVTIAGEEVEL